VSQLSGACGIVTPVSEDLQQLLDRHVAAGAAPGVVAIIGNDDGAEVVTAGVASLGGAPMPADAIMRIQSMTKVITAVATLRLVENGELDLDQPIEEWLPELADRRVLTSPTAALDDTVAAERPITVRHLLTNTSGYGMILSDSPLQGAMADNGTAAGPEPVAWGADEWLRRLADLPLAFQPGRGWRYHHSFGVLGILLARVTGRPLGEHLAAELFGPLGMVDTALWVPADKVDRLPAAYRHGRTGFVETEPAAGGFYAGPPPFDVDHGELVSTARDFYRFARALADDTRLINAEHARLLGTDQVPDYCKTPDSFFPGFWDGMGWGFGVAVQGTGRHRGRYGWSGGLGTDFFIDPDGTVGVLLTQVEMGSRLWPLITDFQELPVIARRS
jgi:CubicO group peptidase (beta-lactamase class C family)